MGRDEPPRGHRAPLADRAPGHDVPASGGWRASVTRAGATALRFGTIPLVAMGLSQATGLLSLLPDGPRAVISLLALPALAAFLFGMAARWLVRPRPPAAFPLRSPVRGRWRAMNGPATKVPSHGTHLFGQTYAIDLVHEPGPGARPSFGGRPALRRPEDFPAFGQPVLCPVAGHVVAVRDGERDHRARSSWLAYPLMLVEGLLRSLRGATGLMGNHVVIEVADEADRFVTIAHLQRGSARVAVGDHVAAGDHLADVGNSGNSSEPHVHLQVTDRRRHGRALGLPFTFTDVVVTREVTLPGDAEPHPVVPKNGARFHGGVGHGDRSG